MTDVGQLYLLGSPDLRETFGSYRVVEIAGSSEGEDPHSHRTRVRGILTALRTGRTFERPILVAESADGPFSADFRMTEIDDTFSWNLADFSGFCEMSVIWFPGRIGFRCRVWQDGPHV